MTEPASPSASLPPFGACPPSGGRTVFDEALNRELTRVAFPDFWLSQLTHCRFPSRWVAACKDEATTGLYAVVTADLNVLTLHQA